MLLDVRILLALRPLLELKVTSVGFWSSPLALKNHENDGTHYRDEVEW